MALASPLAVGAPALAADEYVAALIDRARAENLAADPQWLALGFWQPDLIGNGVTSLFDDSDFFLAQRGKTDPTAELKATLLAFSAPATADPDAHPQCAKPARFRWLKQRLAFDPTRLPDRPCPRLQEWLAAIDPGRLTLIFPAAYLNNPSSMFGHTLIRIDSSKTRGPLTAHTVHFAADHHGETGAFFAIKGLAGGYQGYFAVMPYYEKVTQYSDIENRDIWEYELNYTQDQIRRMLESLWEVNLRPIDYYFFSTNCSYVLLSLLQVGRPDLHLTAGFPVYAIPIDTVRATIDGTGLLHRAVFRPSQRTQIGEQWRRLNGRARELVVALADGETAAGDAAVSTLPATERARVLELAQAYLQYRLDTASIARGEMAPRALALLRARARIDDAGPPQPEPPAVRPDEGHHSARLGVGAGVTGNRPFAELALRPAYHDLLDPWRGYVPGAAIDFLDVHLRWYATAVPSLESATLIGIESLTPRDDLFRALSWRVQIGVERFRDRPSQAGDLVGSAGGGAGPSWDLADTVRIYALADAAVLADGHWPNGRVFGVGPAIGLLWRLTPWWTVRPEAKIALLVENGARDAFQASLQQSFSLGRDLSLSMSVAVRNDGGETYSESLAMLSWYF
jgi:hypothetical protein